MMLDRVARMNDTKRDHAHGADDGRAGPIDFQAGKLAQRKNHIAGEKDDVGRQDADIGQGGGRESMHFGPAQDNKSQTYRGLRSKIIAGQAVTFCIARTIR